MLFVCVTVAIVFLASSSHGADYLRVYPEETLNNTRPLYFGLMQSFGEEFNASGVIGGVEVALDQINRDETMLPGYTLHYTLTDSQVKPAPCRSLTCIHVYTYRYLSIA